MGLLDFGVFDRADLGFDLGVVLKLAQPGHARLFGQFIGTLVQAQVVGAYACGGGLVLFRGVGDGLLGGRGPLHMEPQRCAHQA